MKRGSIIILAMVLGTVFMVGCGGGGDSVPRSSPTYAGSSMPAVLDSAVSTQDMATYLLWDIAMFSGQFGGGGGVPQGTTTSGTDDFVEGGDGGSFTYSGSHSVSWGDTYYKTDVMQSLVFDNFADSSGVNVFYSEGSEDDRLAAVPAGAVAEPQAPRLGGIYFEELQAGRGSMYREASSSVTTDGIEAAAEPNSLALAYRPIGSGPVGRPVADAFISYVNYNGFYTSEGHAYDGYSSRQRQVHQSGFGASNMSGAYNSTHEVWSFEDTLSSNYAMGYFYSYDNDYSEPYSDSYDMALLNFSQGHSWDLSTVNFVSSGTYCAEGEVGSYVLGCVDFDVSLNWDNDASGEYSNCRYSSNPLTCYGQPQSGSITLQADGATASFAYTPGGTAFTFDAGDGSAVFETTLAPIIDF